MDLGTTIIGIICGAACALPFFLANNNRKEKEKQMRKALQVLAEQQNCEITNYENCGNYIIGIDEIKNFIFFQYRDQEDNNNQKFVDLSTIGSCNISRISTSISNGKLIDQLYLVLVPKEKGKPNINLEFYDNNTSSQLSGQLQSIERWNELIKKRL